MFFVSIVVVVDTVLVTATVNLLIVSVVVIAFVGA
jgi:hypothetical protein